MRKIAFIIIGICVFITICSFGFANASDFLSKEGAKYFADIIYQQKQQYELCGDLYNDPEKTTICYNNSMFGYKMIVMLIAGQNMIYKSGKYNEFDRKVDLCIRDSILLHWKSEKNTALWFFVIYDIEMCLRKIYEEHDQKGRF